MATKRQSPQLMLLVTVAVLMAGPALSASISKVDQERRGGVFFMEVLRMKEMVEGRLEGDVERGLDRLALQEGEDLPNLPELVKMQKHLSDLLNLVVDAGLAGALSGKGPLTLFGPTNKAFKAIEPIVKQLNKTQLVQVLTYHVLGGVQVESKDITDELTAKTLMGQNIRFNIYPKKTQTLEAATVVTAQCAPIDLANVDKMASNGVLHELKAVMVPPSGSIVDVAVKMDNYKTLVKALTAADLVNTLAGAGPFTVFAPTDAAFAKLPAGTLDNLLKNKTALTYVLEYHVAKFTYCKAGLELESDLQMLNGQKVQIVAQGDDVKVNGNPVMFNGFDGGVTNGVIHRIESVLIPPSL